MNDMRDLENGFKREPLGVGVGDSLPEPDDREALAERVAAHACAERHNGLRVGTAMDRLRAAFKDGAAWQRWRHPEPIKPSREDVARALDQVDAEQRGRVEAWARDTDPATLCHAPRMTNAVRADAVLALWPGRSVAEVKAEALREAAEAYRHTGPSPYTVPWLIARADRIERGES